MQLIIIAALCLKKNNNFKDAWLTLDTSDELFMATSSECLFSLPLQKGLVSCLHSDINLLDIVNSFVHCTCYNTGMIDQVPSQVIYIMPSLRALKVKLETSST